MRLLPHNNLGVSEKGSIEPSFSPLERFCRTGAKVGNGRNTVSRVLFRKKRTHWASLSFGANSVSSARNSVSSLWRTNYRLRGTHWVPSPGTQWAPKNSLSSVFETLLPETLFGPFPKKGLQNHRQGSIEPFVSKPPFFRLPFQNFSSNSTLVAHDCG